MRARRLHESVASQGRQRPSRGLQRDDVRLQSLRSLQLRLHRRGDDLVHDLKRRRQEMRGLRGGKVLASWCVRHVRRLRHRAGGVEELRREAQPDLHGVRRRFNVCRQHKQNLQRVQHVQRWDGASLALYNDD